MPKSRSVAFKPLELVNAWEFVPLDALPALGDVVELFRVLVEVSSRSLSCSVAVAPEFMVAEPDELIDDEEPEPIEPEPLVPAAYAPVPKVKPSNTVLAISAGATRLHCCLVNFATPSKVSNPS